jgi:hypothetical protein
MTGATPRALHGDARPAPAGGRDATTAVPETSSQE